MPNTVIVVAWHFEWTFTTDRSFGILGIARTREEAMEMVFDAIMEFAQSHHEPFEYLLPPRESEGAYDKWIAIVERNASCFLEVHLEHLLLPALLGR